MGKTLIAETGELIDEDTPTPTSEEIDLLAKDKAKSYRFKRDLLLNESDWVVTKASEEGTAIPSDWKTYRQALRDLTSHENFPDLQDSDYPNKPS